MRSSAVAGSVLATVLLTTLLTTAVLSRAQEEPELPGPEKQHAWLQKFVGRWKGESEALMGADQPALKCTSTMESRMLGPFWVISEMEAEMSGTKIQSLQTIGYDPAKKKYVGTWVDSMVNYLWRYDGTVDETGRILVFEAEGPNFMADGKRMKFRDSYEFKSPDHILLESSMLGDDGKWATFMTGSFHRVK